MQKVQVHKVGLVFGAYLGLFHLVWSLLVATGLAQGLLNFIFKVHMINPLFTVAPFNLTMSVTLIIITALVGYVGGSVIGWLWNKFVVR